MEQHEKINSKASALTDEIQRDQPVQGREDLRLQHLGKRPVLKRNFGFLSIFGFSCTILGTWEGILGTFIKPLENGGPGGTVYSFIFAWLGTAALFVVLSELVSMAPTAGGQYHWAAMLAPIEYHKFLSYLTGWLAVLGWQTGLASFAFLTGTAIQGAAILGNSHYQALPWHGTLLVWASLLCAIAVNLVGGKFLPRVETVTLVVHVLGFFGVMIPLVYMSDHKSREEVFLEFLNNGQFPTQGLAWFVGLGSCAFAFAGGDSVVHMAEEVENASLVIPQAMMLSVTVNGCLGFGILVAVLFCVGKTEDALSSPTGYPFMEMFYQAAGSQSGALAMCSILLANYCCTLIGFVAAASRQLWSFSRDRAVPGWRWWSQVSPSRKLPLNSIYLSVVVSGVLALINIGSSIALEDILSMAVSGVYMSYLIVLILLLYRRVCGGISRSNDGERDVVNVPGAKLVWGPFHCPGIWGILINSLAAAYCLIVIFFSFWPSKMHPTAEDMNWSVVVTGGTTMLAILYYFVRARRTYNGPVQEILEN